jgi:hypothetical protein
LLVAALFQPLLKLVQQLVDWWFYRSKYDAVQVVARFSETEVNLEQLCSQLLTVVQETVQPTTLSLWLCPRKSRKNPERGFLSPQSASLRNTRISLQQIHP